MSPRTRARAESGWRNRLSATDAELGLVHKIRAKNRHILLKPSENGLTDTERLKGFLVRAGEEVLVVRCGHAEDIAKKM